MTLLEYLKENKSEIESTPGSDLGYRRRNFINKKLDEGVEFLVKGNSNGHNYGAIGNKINVEVFPGSVTAPNPSVNSIVNYLTRSGNSIKLSEIEVRGTSKLKDLEVSLKSLSDRKKEIEGEVKFIKSKIAFMKSNDLEEFNENEFKAFSVLQEINSSSSDIEKAKVIAKIISG